MALLLYLTTATAILLVWRRFVQAVPLRSALVLLLLPLLFTGRALLTGRVYAPVDLAFMAEPLHEYARDYGVQKPYDIALSDLHCQIIPWQKAVRYSLSHGQWPLWNPFILCGDVLAAAAQPAVYDPLQLVSLLVPLPDAVTFGATMTFFLAALFSWALARVQGLGEIGALVAAAGYSFCGMMAFFVGWPLGRAWSFLPLVLYGARRVAREGSLRSGVILACGFVLTIVAGHPESVLHVVAVGAAYGTFEILLAARGGSTSNARARGALRSIIVPVVVAIGAGVVALLLTAVYLLPFLDAVPQTIEHEIRRDFYARTSYDVLAPPEVRLSRMGRTFVPGYGGQPWRGTAAPKWDPLSARVGPAVLLLALIGIVVARRRPETWFFALLAASCLSATFGSWPVAHLLHALPMFDLAINERLAFAATLSMAMLAAFAIDRIASIPRGPRYAVLLFALLLVQRSIEDGAIYPSLPRSDFYPRVPILDAIPRGDRMAGLWFALTPNDAAMYELEDVRGYQAMTFKRLYETYSAWSVPQRAWFNRIDDLTSPLLSMMNVRYVIARTDPPPGWRIVAEDRGTRLLENSRALPRAFVPRRVRYQKGGQVFGFPQSKSERRRSAPATESEERRSDPQQSEERRSDPNAGNWLEGKDFADLSWIEAPEYEPHEIVNGPGRVRLRRSGLEYDMDAAMVGDGWVVVSATAWRGWRAYVDGRRVKPHFANHAFLGVFVGKGRHRVRLIYLPESFTRGRNVSLTTLLLIAAAWVCYRTRAWSRFFSIFRRQSV